MGSEFLPLLFLFPRYLFGRLCRSACLLQARSDLQGLKLNKHACTRVLFSEVSTIIKKKKKKNQAGNFKAAAVNADICVLVGRSEGPS